MTVNHPVPGSSPGGGVNGLEYIRAHISERKKNRNNNPCERGVGSPLVLPLLTSSGYSQSSIAQLVEQVTVNHPVPGSSPGGGVREISAAVAQLLYTQLVTSSNLVFPILSRRSMKNDYHQMQRLQDRTNEH